MGVSSSEAELAGLLGGSVASAIIRERSLFDELAGNLGSAIVVFGAGNLGRKTLAGLRTVGVEALALADSNPLLWHTSVDGASVLSPTEAAARFGRVAVFVVAIYSPGPQRRFSCVAQQLRALGCTKVVPVQPLFWKFADVFLPHLRLDLPHKVLLASESVKGAFRLWQDEESRREYLTQLKLLVRPAPAALSSPMPQEPYLPPEIRWLSADEEFVDCGAYTGDTIRSFIEHQRGAFRSIVAIEPDPLSFAALCQSLLAFSDETRSRISALQLAIGARKGRVRFAATGTVSSAITETGNVDVECVLLDELLADRKPTYIKMDIEGAERDALLGACASITRHVPALAVCAYHRQQDLWQLPLLIASMSDRYRFYLRRYGDEFGDVVCYAVPASRTNASAA